MVGIRIDIDSLRDTRMLPLTLELLDRYDIKASFFVATGIDETYRNFRHYLNPFKLLKRGTIDRYGMDAFSGLLKKEEVQRSKELQMIVERGHELGLHGYLHYDWMNYLDARNEEEITSWISKGTELFENTFGFYPECFAAPGFKASDIFLNVLDGFGFKYSSDFMDKRTFYPGINGVKLKTLQVPVSLAIGEHNDAVALQILEEQVSDGYSVFYFHPSYEPVFRKKLLEEAISFVADKAVPLGELIK